jgi:5'-nucleotidase
MRILVSNDDGYRAQGIVSLYESLQRNHEPVIVAPDRNVSGTSHALSLRHPLYVHRIEESVFAVEGTPVDCVHLATTLLLEEKPDLVISGINHGGNMGDDVLYSGTVAAAMEGRHLGFASLAVSLVNHVPRHFDTASRIVDELLVQLETHGLPEGVALLNVNVPDLPYDDIRGMRVTTLGTRGAPRDARMEFDVQGNPLYWLGLVGKVTSARAGTDFEAIDEGYVSVTPLAAELVHRKHIGPTEDWIMRGRE